MRKRRGTTLVEVLVVVAVLAALMPVLGSLFWSTARIQQAGLASFEDLQRRVDLFATFRDDVAQATELPEFAGDHQASEFCMLLTGPDGDLVVYRGGDGTVTRRVLRAKGGDERTFALADAEAKVRFARRGRLAEMTIAPPHRGTTTIAAAMGGGRR